MTTYNHTTFGQAKAQLAALLGDPSRTFWTDSELGLYLVEALRVWSLGTCFHRATAQLTTSPGIAFYDIPSLALGIGGEPVQGYSVTDRQLIGEMLYHLMEPQIMDWPGGWAGTEMFSLAEVVDTVAKGREDLQRQTAAVVSQDRYVQSGGDQRVNLSPDLAYLRRASWQEDGQPLRRPIWPIDEHQAQTTSRSAIYPQPDQPKGYVLASTPELSMDLWPAPRNQGTVRTLEVKTGLALDPMTAAFSLQWPDDAAHLIKYRALADLFAGDGLARAPQMAAYCEERVKVGVEMVKRYQSVLWADLGGRMVTVSSLAQRDATTPGWESVPGMPKKLALPAWNLLALSPVPDQAYTITLEMVRRAPIPQSDGDYLQVGREHLVAIYDYGQHLAMLKMQGAEFLEGAQGLLQSFLEAVSEARSKWAAETPTYWELERLGRLDRNWRPVWKMAADQEAREEAAAV